MFYNLSLWASLRRVTVLCHETAGLRTRLSIRHGGETELATGADLLRSTRMRTCSDESIVRDEDDGAALQTLILPVR